MKVTGSATLHAPREQVWAALNDPAVLVRTIPGCHQLEEVGPDTYRMTLTAGVASIKGTYQGDVALTDQEQPGAFTLRASGAGAPGHRVRPTCGSPSARRTPARPGSSTTPTRSSAA